MLSSGVTSITSLTNTSFLDSQNYNDIQPFKGNFLHKWKDNGEKYISQSFRSNGKSFSNVFIDIN